MAHAFAFETCRVPCDRFSCRITPVSSLLENHLCNTGARQYVVMQVSEDVCFSYLPAGWRSTRSWFLRMQSDHVLQEVDINRVQLRYVGEW